MLFARRALADGSRLLCEESDAAKEMVSNGARHDSSRAMQPDRLTERCQRRLPEALDFLREMVTINSFTANAAGIDRVGKLIAASFAELGFTPRFISPSHPE